MSISTKPTNFQELYKTILEKQTVKNKKILDESIIRETIKDKRIQDEKLKYETILDKTIIHETILVKFFR